MKELGPRTHIHRGGLDTSLVGAGGGEWGEAHLDGGGRGRAVWRLHGRGEVLVRHCLGHGMLLADHRHIFTCR